MRQGHQFEYLNLNINSHYNVLLKNIHEARLQMFEFQKELSCSGITTEFTMEKRVASGERGWIRWEPLCTNSNYVQVQSIVQNLGRTILNCCRQEVAVETREARSTVVLPVLPGIATGKPWPCPST